MRCLHVRRGQPANGIYCGQETGMRCSHCKGPRCVNHGIMVNGQFLCLSDVRVALALSRTEKGA